MGACRSSMSQRSVFSCLFLPAPCNFPQHSASSSTVSSRRSSHGSRLWFPLFLSSAVGNEPHFPLVWIRRRVNGSSYPQAVQKYTRRVLPPAYQPLSLCVIYPSQTGCVQNSSIPVRIFGLSRSSVSSSEHGPSKQRERSPYFDKNVKKWYNKAFKKRNKGCQRIVEPMDLTEKTLSREDCFDGKLVHVHVDQVRLPNGQTAAREVVDHVDGVAVLPLDERGNVLAVTQYRYVFGKTLLEIPAGKLDPGEDPVTGALRELKEETGAVPDIFLPLGRILPAPGCYGEALYLFLARGLHMEEQALDPDEFLQVERIPFPEMVHRCLTGEIEDAKTVVAVLKAKVQLNL